MALTVQFDKTSANLLSSFFLDVAKAAFIGASVTSPLLPFHSGLELISFLTKGIIMAILYLIAAWYFAKFAEHL